MNNVDDESVVMVSQVGEAYVDSLVGRGRACEPLLGGHQWRDRHERHGGGVGHVPLGDEPGRPREALPRDCGGDERLGGGGEPRREDDLSSGRW